MEIQRAFFYRYYVQQVKLSFDIRHHHRKTFFLLILLKVLLMRTYSYLTTNIYYELYVHLTRNRILILLKVLPTLMSF